MNQTITTRFAPSPTGMLHIGGARTALFNYLFALKNGGQYLLRIEDTDRERSTEAAKQVIKEGLAWLGLGPTDGEWVLQTENIETHKKAVEKLIAEGKAYECFTSPEELEAMREEQRAKGENIRYDGRHRHLTEEQKAAFRAEGRIPVVRLRVEETGTTAWDDAVQGRIEIANSTLDDFVILRGDGFPIYNFVVAADDHAMNITHVIRGDDHINNTPKQIFVYKALGYNVPTFAHIPMIHGKNGKMSKRDGATNVLEYREAGFLPSALLNYLMRLGWSLGNEEMISMETAIQNFDIKNVHKSPAVFDMVKLEWYNAQYIKQTPVAELLEHLKPFLEKRGLTLSPKVEAYLLGGGLESLKPRAKRLTDLAEAAEFFFKEAPFTLEAKEAEILKTEGYKNNLTLFLNKAKAENAELNHDKVSEIVNSLCEETGLKFKDFGMPLRVALTGTTTAPGIGEVMEAFGKEESLKRIEATISTL